MRRSRAVLGASMLVLVAPLAAGGESLGAAAAGSSSACSVFGADITGRVSGTLSADNKRLDVALNNDDLLLTAVNVSGGGRSTMYVGGPFTGLTAPSNRGGQTPGISGWFACGVPAHWRDRPTPPGPPDLPQFTRRPSPTDQPGKPTSEPTETPDPTVTTGPTETPEPPEQREPPEQQPEPTEDSEPTEQPEVTSPGPTESPTATDGTEEPSVAKVPTSIPAGIPPAGDAESVGGWTVLGIVAVGAAGGTAAAVVGVRRRRADV